MKKNDFSELKTYLEVNNSLTANFLNNSGQFPDDKLKESVVSHNRIRPGGIRHFRKNSLRNMPSRLVKIFPTIRRKKACEQSL